MIAIIGAGGHGKCVYECFYQAGLNVLGFFDDNPAKIGSSLIDGLKVIDSSDKIAEYEEISGLFLALGDNRKRIEKYRLFAGRGYSFPNAVHKKAHLSEFAEIGSGNFFMGPAVVNPGSKIGNCCIINTSATIGHDCILENGVQVGPGVNIAGGCHLHEEAFVGIGAKIAPGVVIGPRTVVGAGSVVLRDLPADAFANGVPAKIKNCGS